jgi:diguanylate cyclase (GGDEF)-like protein
MSASSRASISILFSQTAAALVALVGGIVLMGWLLNIAILKSVAPNLVSMKANTAALLLAAGVALFLFDERSSNTLRRHIGRLLAAVVLVIAGLTLFQYAGSMNAGIDELLFRDDTRTTATSHPGRMAPMTAASLMLCGLALLLIDRSPRVSRQIAMVVLVFATLGIAGYVFGAQSLYRVSSYTSMAVHTAAALMVLSLGVIAARTKQGCVAVIIGDTVGGIMARRLLWFIPALLFALGWLRFQGQLAGLYDDRFGLALMVVVSMTLSSIVIMAVASVLKNVDDKRQQAQDQLVALNASLEQVVAERTDELERTNQKLTTEIAERRQAEEEVRRLSLTDELTGLLNRRGFLLLAEQNLKTARRAKAVCSLFFLDLNGLKRVNDNYGHRAGDALIANTAQVLKASFRDADIIARLGGDEFAILAANGEHTDIMLARMQAAVGQFNKGDATPHQLSFSVGAVRCLPTEEKSLLELLADADTLMYEQKQERGLRT